MPGGGRCGTAPAAGEGVVVTVRGEEPETLVTCLVLPGGAGGGVKVSPWQAGHLAAVAALL